MNRYRAKRIFAVGGTLSGVLGAIAPQASAQESPFTEPQVDVEVDFIDASEMVARDIDDSSLLPNVEGDPVQEYLDEQAQQGRLVDLDSLNLLEAGPTVVVREDGLYLDEVQVAAQSVNGTVGQVEMAGNWGEDPDSDPSFASYSSAGLGMDGLLSDKNGMLKGHGCLTIKHRDGHRFSTCYEKWKAVEGNSSRDNYLYNRWGTATARGDGNIHTYTVKEFTMRSRPWNGTRNRLLTMSNYWPKAGTQHCQNGASIKVTAGPFEATLPFNDCSRTEILENLSSFEMGIKWTGEANSQVASDYAFSLDSKDGQEAVFADYAYAKFRDYQTFGCLGGLCYHDDALWDYDTGWPR